MISDAISKKKFKLLNLYIRHFAVHSSAVFLSGVYSKKKSANIWHSIEFIYFVFIILVIFVIADISYKCFLAAVTCRSQNLVAWKVSQSIDGGE